MEQKISLFVLWVSCFVCWLGPQNMVHGDPGIDVKLLSTLNNNLQKCAAKMESLTDAPIEDKQSCDNLVIGEQLIAEDCSDVQNRGYKSGLYQVRPLGADKPYIVYCDLDTDGGGWTVLQYRYKGTESFNRTFEEYATGFGEINGEHWAGLETMHQLTSRRDYELFFHLEDFENVTKFASYKTFLVDSRENGYRLTVKNYSGNAGDSFGPHNSLKFTTYDVDNDQHAQNCAVMFKGAWWYGKCHSSNLNGLYSSGVTKEFATGMVWKAWRGHHYSLKVSKMMMRPLKFTEMYSRNDVLLQKKLDAIEATLKTLNVEDLRKKLAKFEELHKQSMETIKQLAQKITNYETLLNNSAALSPSANIASQGYVADSADTDILEDCAYAVGASGIYIIKPPGAKEPFAVYCDLTFQNKKWTVIQSRFNGSVDFYRYFKDYKRGFGDLDGEHWLGLEHVYQITKNGEYELYIDMSDFDGENKYALYGDFSLCSQADDYRLNIEGFSGNAGDSLSHHRGRKFSTHDKDLDKHSSNCAATYKGAWWYNACHESNLNGFYQNGTTKDFATGVVWKGWRGYHYSLKTTRLLIRKKDVNYDVLYPRIDVRFKA